MPYWGRGRGLGAWVELPFLGPVLNPVPPTGKGDQSLLPSAAGGWCLSLGEPQARELSRALRDAEVAQVKRESKSGL